MKGEFKENIGNPAHSLRDLVRNNHSWKENTIAAFYTSEPNAWEGSAGYGRFVVLYLFDVQLIPTNMDSDKGLTDMSHDLIQLIKNSGITSSDLINMVWERGAWFTSPACRYYLWGGYYCPEFSVDTRLKSYKRKGTYWWNETFYADHDGYYRSYYYDEGGESSRIAWSPSELESW